MCFTHTKGKKNTGNIYLKTSLFCKSMSTLNKPWKSAAKASSGFTAHLQQNSTLCVCLCVGQRDRKREKLGD